MFKYAFRSLIQERTKLILSVGGVAFALILILTLDGIFIGISRRMTVYIDTSQADIYVMQSGVKNMHMARSFLPKSLEDKLSEIKGVEEVTSINYGNSATKLHNKRLFSYLIGIDPKASFGGPADVIKGKTRPGKNEILLDEVVVKKHGYKIGDRISLIGKRFRLAGITKGTYSMASTITFFNKRDLAGLVPPGSTSYFLVRIRKGYKPEIVADEINSKVDGVNALSRSKFSENDRKIASDMGADVINIMTVIGFISAILIVALTTYTATLEKIRDYGVLKAIGAKNRNLYQVAIGQTTISAFIGLTFGVALTYLIARLINSMFPELSVVIEVGAFAKAIIATVLISLLASYIPIRSISKVDPLLVFKS